MDDKTKAWMEKIEAAKKEGFDLSRDEDLSIALMNLISIEEHSYFTAMKTGNSKYLGIMDSTRNLRKNLLKRIVKNPKGEEWCISKHLLAASMRLVEVGTKEQSQNNKKDAEFMFTSAFHLYSLFFAINLGLVEVEELKVAEKKENRLTEIIKKLVDCCKE